MNHHFKQQFQILDQLCLKMMRKNKKGLKYAKEIRKLTPLKVKNFQK